MEKDPTGRKASDPGAKLDLGKNRVGMVLHGFANAIYEVGLVGTHGAKKYSDFGWEKVPNAIQRYEDAAIRHYIRQWIGEDVDTDSGLLHCAHAAWNALAILELKLREAKNDKR